MNGARVDSVDALKHFRVALWKFAEAANVALGDAEGEVQRTLMWLQTELPTFWEGQIRKRHDLVNRCKEAVRQKKLFKDSTGRTQSAVDEEKQLLKAQRRLEEAEQRLGNTKRHAMKLQRELHMYKGGVMRLSTNVTGDLPTAVALLDRMVESLEAYLSLHAEAGAGDMAAIPVGAGTSGAAGSSAGNMARSDTEEMPETADGPIEENATAEGEGQIKPAK